VLVNYTFELKIKTITRNALIILFAFCATVIFGQNKVLVVLAHPNLIDSEVNKSFASELRATEGVTVHDLYKSYPDFNIDVNREQELLVSNDIVIFQFPLYWFSSPALLKKWQDDVITSDFSIGENNRLKGKKLLVVVSAGGTYDDYRHGGLMDITMDEVLSPFKTFAHLTEMEYLSPFVTYGVPNPKILNIPMTAAQRIERQRIIESHRIKLAEIVKNHQ